MNKWIKFLQVYDGHTAGEIVEVDEKAAEVLIKSKLAEATEEPKEVGAKATELTASLQKFVEDQITTGLNSGFEKIAKELTPKGADKRPRIATHDNAEDDASFGYKNISEQVRDIMKFCQPVTRDSVMGTDRFKRLMVASTKAPSTFANEGVGADGGFLIAPNFLGKIITNEFMAESLLGRTDSYTTGSNNMTIPKDETTPWGTSGVQGNWTAEATQLTQSKPKIGQDNLTLHKYSVLVPVTNEQMDDSFVGLGSYVSKKASENIMWAADDAIVNGTGAGKPLGVINSGALIQQAAEGSQTAATINLTNIAKMISRIPMTSIKNLVWLIHPSAFPQIVVLTNGNSSLYVAPGGVASANATLGTLFGIPVIISQHCQSVGTPGDIFLFDMSKYLTLTKGDGIRSDMSLHLYFDYDVLAFRFIFRLAGQPWMQAPITSAYGSYSMSPFVNLAQR